MITRRPALLLRRVLGRRPLSSTSTTTGGDAAAANADASGGKGGKGGATAMEGALRGKSRRELAAFHPLLRTAQVIWGGGERGGVFSCVCMHASVCLCM